MPRSPRVPVYAVIRIDKYFNPAVNATKIGNISITEVLPTFEEAEQEVIRLNKQAKPGAEYSVITTRFFPEGRSHNA